MVTVVQAVVIGIAAFFLGGVIGVVVMAIAGASRDDFGRDAPDDSMRNADFSGLPRPTTLPPLGPAPLYHVGVDPAIGKPCDVPDTPQGPAA